MIAARESDRVRRKSRRMTGIIAGENAPAGLYCDMQPPGKSARSRS